MFPLLLFVGLIVPLVSSFQVSHREPEILVFKLQQSFIVGFLQPSSVTAYEYYNPGRQPKSTLTLQLASGNASKTFKRAM